MWKRQRTPKPGATLLLGNEWNLESGGRKRSQQTQPEQRFWGGDELRCLGDMKDMKEKQVCIGSSGALFGVRLTSGCEGGPSLCLALHTPLSIHPEALFLHPLVSSSFKSPSFRFPLIIFATLLLHPFWVPLIQPCWDDACISA